MARKPTDAPKAAQSTQSAQSTGRAGSANPAQSAESTRSVDTGDSAHDSAQLLGELDALRRALAEEAARHAAPADEDPTDAERAPSTWTKAPTSTCANCKRPWKSWPTSATTTRSPA